MTDSEAINTYNVLVETLGKSGLEWVSAQVRQEVVTGRTITKAVPVLKEELTRSGRRRQESAEFLSTKPYSPQEQLQLLLNAIEQTIVGTAEMQRSTLNMLRVKDHPVSVEFLTETDMAQGRRYGGTEIDQRTASVSVIHNLLSELRTELKNAD